LKIAVPAHPEVPISKAVRAGDFVFTSAYGPWTFDPADVTFDADGRILDDGTGNRSMPFEEQVHRTFGFIEAALASAGCGLEDVVGCECWLTDARDFVAFNAIYRTYFKTDPPVRSVFPTGFMFCCRVEMKVVAYKPLAA
jgi:2-iminobutanoate/2-iminopropanoate deaminase